MSGKTVVSSDGLDMIIKLTIHLSKGMAFQAIYDSSNSHPFHEGQQRDKVVIQEKIFPNRLLHMPTTVKIICTYIINYQNIISNAIIVCSFLFVYVRM